MRAPTSLRTDQRVGPGYASVRWEWLDECAVRVRRAAHGRDVEGLQTFVVELARRLAEAVLSGGVAEEPVDVDADHCQGPWCYITARLLRVGPTLALVRVELAGVDARATWLVTLRRREPPMYRRAREGA